MLLSEATQLIGYQDRGNASSMFFCYTILTNAGVKSKEQILHHGSPEKGIRENDVTKSSMVSQPSHLRPGDRGVGSGTSG